MEKYKIIGTDLKNKQAIVVLICMWASSLFAQQWNWWPLTINDTTAFADTIQYHAYVSALVSSGNKAPFLLRANQHGNIAQTPYSSNFSAAVIKPATCPTRWWDYDFAVQLTGQTNTDPKRHWGDNIIYPTTMITGYFEQLYAHTRLYVVDITAGIKPMVYGSQSRRLSMGGLLFSGNAHPIPRITIGIEDYIPFPGLFGYFEIKGGITYGWLSEQDTYVYESNIFVDDVKLHHKFIGLRVGGRLPVTLAYEMHHAAQWGGYKQPLYSGERVVDYGNTFADFLNVFLFRSGGISMSDQLNAQGNHIGVQELALTYKQHDWQVRAYWQSIFEDMSAAFIGFGMNAADGLWGLNIQQSKWPFVQEMTYEFLNTTSQSGSLHDKDGLVFAGRDSYYHNSAYPAGWTYFGAIIGNPYIQVKNSRVRAHLVGLSGDIYGFKYRAIASYVDNYGVYQNVVPDFTFDRFSNNTSLLLEVSRQFEKAWGLEFSVALAGDIGTQYGNSFGGYLRIAKTGLITAY